MTWIQTYTGRAFDLMNPRAQDVNIFDIAHALSMKCRFTGHCRRFYSVAEHSIYCAKVALDKGHRALALDMLLHDVGEAYLPDIAGPIKHLVVIGGLRADLFEDRIVREVYKSLELDYPIDPIRLEEIKRIDLTLLATEKRDLMVREPKKWIDLPDPLERILPYEAPNKSTCAEQFIFMLAGLVEWMPC